MPQQTSQSKYEQFLYDTLILVSQEIGDYGSKEYKFKGTLAGYTLRVGKSVTDESSVIYILQNTKLWLNLYKTKKPRIWVGKEDNSDTDFYIFIFDTERNRLNIFKRRLEF
jgi:hypothetical protein